MKQSNLLLILALCVLASLAAAKPTAKPAKTPRIDLVFCVDTTGSMADEIDVVKDRIKDMIAKIADGKPAPEVRVGVVAYRDRGDQYVVRKSDLTDDLDATAKTISEIAAAGGGDKEESVNEALHVAVSGMNWDRTPGITRLVYLIGDAGPHVYSDDFNADSEKKKAAKERIVINAIGCSGITDSEVAFYKKMAQGSEGTFAYLTYREEYAKADGSRLVVLKEGGKSYAYAPSVAASSSRADWRGGAASVDSSAVASVAPSELASASRASAGSDVRDAGGWQVNASTMNNLDVVMTGQAQRLAAKQQGIVYEHSDLVPFLREIQGSKTGLKKETHLVIKDSKSWTELWSQHQAGKAEPEKLPKVDFAKEMVLVVVAPESAKDGVVIREVTQSKGKLTADYAPSSTARFHFAVVKKDSTPVVWRQGKPGAPYPNPRLRW